ncbi:MAG: FAD-dependent thymidylate synthase [Nitrososphaerota archaeon]|nr:FAD-dependent thymidylate synthase [Nitrososphaerota archaeon]
MKVSLLWSSPYPERTVAVAMRRCYSTKTIEEIESELEQKGTDYLRYLLTKALQDKSLDVFEHFTLTLLVEGAGDEEVGALVRDFPYLRATRVKDSDWFVSMNARTLVELWRGWDGKGFAGLVVSELVSRSVCPVFIEAAFGGGVRAS